MSYTKHTWVDGETITAAKMNNIEEGIDDAGNVEPTPSALVVNVSTDEDDWNVYVLDRSWLDIYNAWLVGDIFLKEEWLDSWSNETWVPDPDDPSQEILLPSTSTYERLSLSKVRSVAQSSVSNIFTVADLWGTRFSAYTETDYPRTEGGGPQ